MSKQDCIKMEGTVIEDLSNSMFKVELDNNVEIICTISGKIRQKNIRVMIGDRVQIDMSPYDLSKGRISYRLTGNETYSPKSTNKDAKQKSKFVSKKKK